MTWVKASRFLVAAAIFDLLRIMFEQFWFFGPALVAAYCTAKVGSVVGSTVGGWLCGPVALAAGILGFAAIEVFGIVMAMAVGLVGWLVVFGLLMFFNRRIFLENSGNMIFFGVSLLVSEIPLVGTIPAISLIVWRMLHVQIKKDRAAFAKYEREQETARVEEQKRRALAFMQMETVRQNREAANEAVYAEAANDEEIPEKILRRA